MPHTRQLVFVVGILAILAATTVEVGAREIGAIQKFKEFPVDTFALNGQLSPTMLEETTTPQPSEIAVDGWWPDEKLVLIAFRPQGRTDEEWFYVHFRAVQMVDQARWDTRMRATGTLVCLNKATPTRIAGRNPNTQTAATKGFTNPC